MSQIIPRPASLTPGEGVFAIQPATAIYVDPDTPEMLQLGQYLAGLLQPATGYGLPVRAGDIRPLGAILLTTAGDGELGAEGYELSVVPSGARISAAAPAGVFYGIQTLRQLLPPAIEGRTQQPGIWELPAVTIRDQPRFEWRGAMLDVARHFFGVEEVKRLIDLLAAYKLNRLHLHLTDDQGWRIAIDSWPNLTAYGGSTQVGGGPGGFYSKAEYGEIVAYAASRYIMLVPEIEMPGHSTAALASYPELNCDGQAPPLFTGWTVGISSVCVESEATWRFVDDVVREVAQITPGPFLHIGGDEVETLSHEQYIQFIERAESIVRAHGKRMIGWEEVAAARLQPDTVVQFWKNEIAAQAVAGGSQIIMSPSFRVYMDMKYTLDTPLGLTWAGFIEVQDAYEWDPAQLLAGVSEDNILGIEAPLWTETIETREHIDYMIFPRLLGYAEIGWSPATGRSWDEYRERLGAHASRLAALDIGFYRSPQVDWNS